MTAIYWLGVTIRVFTGAVMVAFAALMLSIAWDALFTEDLPVSFALFAGLIITTLALRPPTPVYVARTSYDQSTGILTAGAINKTPGTAGTSTEPNQNQKEM